MTSDERIRGSNKNSMEMISNPHKCQDRGHEKPGWPRSTTWSTPTDRLSQWDINFAREAAVTITRVFACRLTSALMHQRQELPCRILVTDASAASGKTGVDREDAPDHSSAHSECQKINSMSESLVAANHSLAVFVLLRGMQQANARSRRIVPVQETLRNSI